MVSVQLDKTLAAGWITWGILMFGISESSFQLEGIWHGSLLPCLSSGLMEVQEEEEEMLGLII